MAGGKIDWGGFGEGALETVIKDIDERADIKKKQLEAEQAMETFKAKEDYKSEQSTKQKKMESNILDPFQKFTIQNEMDRNPNKDYSMFEGFGSQGKQGQAAQEQPTAQGVGATMGQQGGSMPQGVEQGSNPMPRPGEQQYGIGPEGIEEVGAAAAILRWFYKEIDEGRPLSADNVKLKKTLEDKVLGIKAGGVGSNMEQYRAAVKRAANGEISWSKVMNDFPTRVSDTKKYRNQHIPVTKAEGFKYGTGPKAFFSDKVAKLDQITSKVLRKIKSEQDLDEFLQNASDYRDAGVDIEAVKEYFGISGDKQRGDL